MHVVLQRFSLRTADAFPVVASLPRFSQGEKRRPEMPLLFPGYRGSALKKVESHILGPVVRRPISANPWLDFNPGFFFFCSKAFSRINQSIYNYLPFFYIQ